MNGLTLLENLKAAAAGGPGDRDPLTGLEARPHFLSAVRGNPEPRLLACISIDPVRRGQRSRSRSVLRKMTARAGDLMARHLGAADHLVCWEPTVLVATFSAKRLPETEANLEALRKAFAGLSFAGAAGPNAVATLTAAVAEWRNPEDTALASALLRARAGVAAAQLRGGDRIVSVDALFGALWPQLLIA